MIKMNILAVVTTLKMATGMATAVTVVVWKPTLIAAVNDRGCTLEDGLNEEDFAISDDEADLHGDAVASF
jgi:hypothetical protein